MKRFDFNKGWLFQKDGSLEVQEVNLPHDAMLFEKRSRTNPAGGASAYFSGGRYSYKKKICTKDWQGKNMVLQCEGVYQNAKVYVNGKLAAERPYGYVNFYAELTLYLHDGENEIEIIADNADTPNSRYYSGAGIYREVHLLVGGDSYIKPNGIKITTENDNIVCVKTDFVGEGEAHVSVWDGDCLVAEADGADVKLTIPNAKTWDEYNPHLYCCKVSLLKGGEAVDEVTERFGIRSISWNGKGFFVNGKETLLRGACVHHDNGILGACSFRDAEYRRVRILKEAGFNAVRSSHNPASKAFLDACDEIGIYVMDETWDYWLIHKNPYDQAKESFESWWQEDIDSMIGIDFNHPSVIMYSIGNEISELGTAEGQILCEKIAKYVKAKDPTRVTTCGINLMLASMAAKGKGIYSNDKDKKNTNGSQTMDSMPTSAFYNVLMNKMGGIIDKMAATKGADKVCDAIAPFLDIPGYNYATSRYEKENKTRPEGCFVGSETLPKTLYRNWEKVKSIPNLIGDFIWTGWDYLGETGLGTIRYLHKKTKENAYPGLPILSGSGVIDICGHPQAEVGWNKIIWGLQSKPVIGVNPPMFGDYNRAMSMWRNTDAVESWSWEGCEGSKTEIVVYADAERAVLILNGKEIGSKKVKECKAVFKNVTYMPGILETVTLDQNGKETGRATLKSAAKDTMIRLSADKNTLYANGQDLCFIELNLSDRNGIIKSGVDRNIQVEVSGDASLQGFGSAVPNTENSFHSGIYRTYYGRALIAVRAGYQAGEATVKVRGEHLEPVEIKIRIK